MDLSVLAGEQLFPRDQETVARYNARVGANVLSWSAFRHALTYGTKTRSGRRIKIPHVRFGRRIFTSLEAIDRWSRAVAEADDAAQAPDIPAAKPARRTSRSANADRVARAQQTLESEGL